MQVVFIINPNSGTDRVKNIRAALEARLDLGKYRYEIATTTHAGHGTEIAREAAKNGAHAVVAVGGDGSVADVAKGLYGTETALGILPKGSGNGLARSLGIPLRLEAAIDRINRGNVLLIDVCFANENLFLSNAGVGFDALVCQLFAGNKKRGFVAYTNIILRQLFRHRAQHWKLTVDGVKMEEDAFMIVAANGRQFGYDFKIAADANCTDGLLDLVIVRRFPHWAGPMIALDALRGKMHRNRFVETRRAASITIESPELSLFQTDGDPHASAGKVVFRIGMQALRVIC